MIDQVKIGNFLRELRKEKGKTQEEIAGMYNVSSRSVSRWENGITLPDLGTLVELADYYEVDIKELIDGERKSENMDNEMKDTLLKVADYADKQKKQAIVKLGREIADSELEAVINGMGYKVTSVRKI